MRLEIEPIEVETAYPFRIARGSKVRREIFIVSLTADGITGMGEAAPQEFYGESAMTVRAAVNSIGRFLDGDSEAVRLRLNDSSSDLHRALRASASVRAALDMALWDIRGRRESKPVWRMIGADAERAPATSFTIGIDMPEVIDAKVDAAAPYLILKVKVGVPGDMEILDRVIARSGKIVRVDANEGWDLETAIEKDTRALSPQGRAVRAAPPARRRGGSAPAQACVPDSRDSRREHRGRQGSGRALRPGPRDQHQAHENAAASRPRSR
jgi:L-alanine-DL-glutamate epimerase-like enolase superfamily enzyme